MNLFKKLLESKIWIKKICVFAFILISIFSVQVSFAEKVEDLNVSRYVNDYANIIDDDVENQLNQRLYDFAASTTHQIVVVTVNNMDGDYIEHYSIKLAEKIKAGTAKNDNGVILLIAKDDRKMRIEVGYGLEGVLTDGVSSNIINTNLKPAFQKGDYTRGISSAVDRIVNITSGEEIPKEGNYLSSVNYSNSNLWVVLFYMVFFGAFVVSWLGSILGRTKSWWLGGVIGFVIALVLFLLVAKIIWFFLLTIAGFVFDYFVSKNYKEKKSTKDGPDWWSGGTWGPGSGGGWGGGYSSSSGGGGFSGGGGGFGGGGSSGSW